ncbi:hypothetical protein SPB21_03530 [Leptothoe sp. ISB3NOV94-8A]
MPQDLVQPPGCAGWHPDEVRPTVEEASNPLFDLSDGDNVRKLARAIASSNTMEHAGFLSGELSYAYQHQSYDCISIAQSISGLDPVAIKEVIDLLKPLNTDVSDLLVAALEEAFEAGQDEYQAHLKYESDPEYRKKMDEMHKQLFGGKK